MALRPLGSLLIALLPTLLLAGLLAALARPASAADGVVDTCDDATFSAVLNSVQSTDGGTITFSCSDPITFLSTKIITSNVTIDGGGNVTLSGGGVRRLFVVNAGARLTLRNLTISNGYAGDDGGAIYNSGHLEIRDSTLRENNTSSNFSGGAILNLGTLTATNASFINNTGGNAGAIYPRFPASRTTIRQSFFWNNRTTNVDNGWGGAILLWDNAPAVISETQFLSNTARNGGGALYSYYSPVVFIDSQFISNTVTVGSGGGLYHTGAVTISGGLFMSNTSQSHGGGAYTAGAVTLSGGLFQGNECKQDGCKGGGLYANSTLALTGTQVINNRSRSSGGGVYVLDAATLNGGLFQDNRCFPDTFCRGGGLYGQSTLGLIGTSFVSNRSEESGGGAYVNGAVTLNGGLFERNQCIWPICVGGGLVAGTLAMTGTSFVSNTAQAQGGGAFAWGAVTLNGGLFERNQCIGANCLGGGLIARSNLAVNQARFVANRASAGGGLAHDLGGNGQVTNSLFANNHAAGGRGAAMLLSSPGSVTLLHNTVASATLGSASAIHVFNGTATALNNLVSLYAVGLERSAGTFNENYSLFSGVVLPYSGTVNSGGNSFSGAAGFANPAGGDFQLAPGSEAIDAGTNAAITVDFFGTPRPQPQGGGFDIGYHEYALRKLYLPMIKR